jgi:hypothetical protein
MISEHGYPTEHGHPVVPYYLHGGRPDVPLFIPRGGPLPGPPPLLASKRDGADPHSVSPFFQGVYPPPVSAVMYCPGFISFHFIYKYTIQILLQELSMQSNNSNHYYFINAFFAFLNIILKQ